MTFGRCMEALRWNQQHSQHNQKVVPFRDSKLTRIFQDYFIGNGKAVMIVNASPSALDYEETCHVLKFSAIAKEVSITTTKLDTGKLKKAMKEENQIIENEEIFDIIENPSNNMNIEENKILNNNNNMIIGLQEQELKEQLEIEKDHLETLIREEVSNELTQKLTDMEKMFKKRLEQEILITEDKYEKKIEMLNRIHNQQIIQEQENYLLLKKENENLILINQQLQQKVDGINSNKKDLEEIIKNLKQNIEQLNYKIQTLQEEINTISAQKDSEIEHWKNLVNNQKDSYKKTPIRISSVHEIPPHQTVTSDSESPIYK